MSKQHRWLPNLWYRHRGNALVTLGLVFWHVISAIDAFFFQSRFYDAHGAIYPVWAPQNAMAPLWIWGLLHLTIIAMITIGAYRDHNDLRLARLGFVWSISTFIFQTLCYIYAFVVSPFASLYGLGGTMLAVLCSYAALQEPSAQIAPRGVLFDGET